MKEYLSARDIEDLSARGVQQVPVSDEIVLTDLARERAASLGITFVSRPASESAPQAAAQWPLSRAPEPTVALGAKPKGCAHTHVELNAKTQRPSLTTAQIPSVEPPSEPISGSLMDRLVEAVRRVGR